MILPWHFSDSELSNGKVYLFPIVPLHFSVNQLSQILSWKSKQRFVQLIFLWSHSDGDLYLKLMSTLIYLVNYYSWLICYLFL
jgi:hypothetical protein